MIRASAEGIKNNLRKCENMIIFANQNSDFNLWDCWILYTVQIESLNESRNHSPSREIRLKTR